MAEATIEEKWWRYLGDQKIGRLATADAAGRPHVTPLFYVVFEEKILIGTQTTRKKFRNIQANNQVCFLVDSGTREEEYKGIQITGSMEMLDDDELHQLYRYCLIQRYYGTEHNPGWRYVRSLPKPQLMRLVPEKILTWDFSNFA